MTKGFKAKDIKDIETARETVISSSSLVNNPSARIHTPSAMSVTLQQSIDESPESIIERRNRLF